MKYIQFNATVNRTTRSEDDTKWRLEFEQNGKSCVEEFDKVVFCHGYQTQAVMPEYEGKDIFQGKLMHAQQFRR